MNHRFFIRIFLLLFFLTTHLFPFQRIFAQEPSNQPYPDIEKLSKNPQFDYRGMVLIPGGKSKIGSTFKEIMKYFDMCYRVDKTCRDWWYKDELPQHKVILDDYWFDKYEVTNADYLKFVLATGHRPALDNSCETDKCREGNLWEGYTFSRSIRNQPVTQVSWDDAAAYCRWLGKRLPTEAEWERAARGPTGMMYPWGSSPPKGRANFKRKWMGTKTMTDVGHYSKGMSVYGIFDMAGNVWEWVGDWYEMNYYKKSPRKNPKGPDEGEFKVVKGGGWVNYGETLHSSIRRWSRPEARFNDTGFRCAKDAVDETQKN